MTSSNAATGAERRTGTARRWTILLICVLTLNTILLGMALSGVAQPKIGPASLESGTTHSESTPTESTPTESTSAEPTPAQAELAAALEAAVECPTITDAVTPEPASPSGIEVTAFVPGIDLPAAVDEPTEPAAEPATLPADRLFIFNPPRTGGEVYFAVDEKVYCLQPGNYLVLPAGAERKIEFHPGGERTQVVRQVSTGALTFHVGNSGWELIDVAAEAAAQLLLTCQPVETGG